MHWLSRISLPCLSALTLLIVLPAVTQAQTVTVRGRVHDAVTSSPVTNANVTIEGVGSVITNQRGEFAFATVPVGSRVLWVQALGYSAAVLPFELRADTTLVIPLNPNPLHIDSLRVVTRRVDVSGKLLERATGRPIRDGAVFASQQRHARSNAGGRFQFRRVPAGVPFEVQVLAFSYQPVLVSFLPDRDTTLIFALVPDTFVQRLVDRQLARLDVRVAQSQGEEWVLSRDTLASFDRGTLQDVVLQLLKYTKTEPTLCYFLDEKESPENPMGFLTPDEIERVEVLHNGATMRVYTRRFMATMISSDVQLNRTGFSQPPRGFRGRLGAPSCR